MIALVMYSLDEINGVLADTLSKSRYDHICRVAETAADLANHWKLSEEAAYLAGLLHDSAKETNPTLLSEAGISLDMPYLDVYKEYPKVWHAFVCPEYCRKRFEVNDEVVLDATKWHTTGQADMSELAEILYLADYVEPGREEVPVSYARELAYQDRNQAVFFLSTVSILRLLLKGLVVHPFTSECRNYYADLLSADDRKMLTDKATSYYSLKS